MPVVRLWLHLSLLLFHCLSHVITILGYSARWLALTPTNSHTICICTSFLSIHALYTLSSFYPLLVHTVPFYPLCMHKASFYPVIHTSCLSIQLGVLNCPFYPAVCTSCLSIQLCAQLPFYPTHACTGILSIPVTVRRYSFYPNTCCLDFLSIHT